MRTFDFSPLFRSTVGFDRMSRLLDAAFQVENGAPSYPPYNIEKVGDDAYRITMAVAGFDESDIEVTQAENSLVVRGKIQKEPEAAKFLYRGIAGRAFERRFQLADHVEVKGASLRNGVLDIDLERELPDAMKPRKIAIAAAGAKRIERKAA